MDRRIAVVLTLLALSLAGASAYAEADPAPAVPAAPPMPKVRVIRPLPASLTLSDARDGRRLLVMGETEEGEQIDLTAAATVTLDSEVAAIVDGYIEPRAVGRAEAIIEAGGHRATLPIEVVHMENPPVGFVRDIEPILAAVGCNAGTCHGAQAGKEGFRLSLRGYDPEFDYHSLINELAGRRVNRMDPEQSLMLLKPAGGVPHEGGKVLDKGTRRYELIRQWIAEGSHYQDLSGRATRIEVLPEKVYLKLPGMSQRMIVIAHYADGTTRDVTREAVIESSNTEVTLAKGDTVTALRRGEGAVLIRYEGNYAARQIIVMGDRTGYAWVQTPRFNYIDGHVHDKLRAMKILPSELCTDAEFIRRVSLDLTGQPATAHRVRAFLDDPSPSAIKRERLVDELLASDAYVIHWSNKWADLLQCNSENLGQKAMWAFRAWLSDAIASNMPYDEFARTLLLARGSSYTNPEVNYYRALKEPGKMTEDISQTFLGIRFNCNKCHDHPFERWTQKQYYEFGSFLAGVAIKKGQLLDEQIVYDSYAGGEVKHPKTDMPVAPKVPFGQAPEAGDQIKRRDALVDWLVSPDNPMFARSMANRVWSYFFGIGIIDPVDDIRASNPPSNPALLDALTQDFLASGFDMRRLMRTICLSRTFQASVKTNKWNEDDKINFSHALPRRLTAEQLVDAVVVATGHRSAFRGLPGDMRAAEVPDAIIEGADVLGLFGKPKRTSACECERSNSFSLSHAINLVNGSTIGDAVSAPDSLIARVVEAEKDNRKVIEELYLAILNRFPTEREYSIVELGEGPDRLANAQDLAWALLNSPAFLYNR